MEKELLREKLILHFHQLANNKIRNRTQFATHIRREHVKADTWNGGIAVCLPAMSENEIAIAATYEQSGLRLAIGFATLKLQILLRTFAAQVSGKRRADRSSTFAPVGRPDAIKSVLA